MALFFQENLEIYQSTRATIIKKNMEANKRNFIEHFNIITAENGFLKKLFRDIPNYTDAKLEKRGSLDGLVHYSGVLEYIAENTRVVALSLEKLDYLFRIYLTIVIAILLLNLAHYWVAKFIIRQTRFYSAKQNLVAFVRKVRFNFTASN